MEKTLNGAIWEMSVKWKSYGDKIFIFDSTNNQEQVYYFLQLQ